MQPAPLQPTERPLAAESKHDFMAWLVEQLATLGLHGDDAVCDYIRATVRTRLSLLVLLPLLSIAIVDCCCYCCCRRGCGNGLASPCR